MSDIRMLELAGDGRPELNYREFSVDDLAQLGRAPPACIRIFELDLGKAHLDWAGVNRLRRKAVGLIESAEFARQLQRTRAVHLDVTRAWREVASASAAIRAQAELFTRVPIVVADVVIPEATDADRWLRAWRFALIDEGEARPTRRIDRPPPQSTMAEAAAVDLIDALLADDARFFDSVRVGRALANDPDQVNPKMVATRKRKAGEVFGVWNGNAYRYPAFQFAPDGSVRARVSELIDALPRDDDGSNNDAALWLFAPDAALDDRTPADVFSEDPARVIALARRRRGDDATG